MSNRTKTVLAAVFIIAVLACAAANSVRNTMERHREPAPTATP